MCVWECASERQKDTESERDRPCECYIACCSHFTPQRCPIETPPMDRMPIKYISFVFASFHWVNPKYLLDVSSKKSVHWKASQQVWHWGRKRSKPVFPQRVTPSVLYTFIRISTEKILTPSAKTKLLKQMELLPFHYDNIIPWEEIVFNESFFLFFLRGKRTRPEMERSSQREIKQRK